MVSRAGWGRACGPILALFIVPTSAFAEVCDKGADAPHGAFGLLLLLLFGVLPLGVVVLFAWRAWLWLWPAALSALLVLASYQDLMTTNPGVRYLIEAAVREGCAWPPTVSLAVWSAATVAFMLLWLAALWREKGRRS